MVDRSKVSDLVPNELLNMLDKLDGDNYLLLCHSTKVSEVKSWSLPYKVMGNEWLNNAVGDVNKVYVIPDYNDRPLTVRYE